MNVNIWAPRSTTTAVPYLTGLLYLMGAAAGIYAGGLTTIAGSAYLAGFCLVGIVGNISGYMTYRRHEDLQASFPNHGKLFKASGTIGLILMVIALGLMVRAALL